MDKIKVKASWNLKDSCDIRNILLVKYNETDSSDALPSSGITFTPRENEDERKPFELSLSVSQPMGGVHFIISSIDVLCNARFMEVFTSGEYQCTEEGIFLQSLENGVRLYILQRSFETPVMNTTLKFVGLQNKNEVFMHSIHVTLCPDTSAVQSPLLGAMAPTFNLDKVKEMIPGSSDSLPQGAQSLLKSMETFQKNKAHGMGQQMGGMAMLMSMFSGMQMNHPGPRATRPQQPAPATRNAAPPPPRTHFGAESTLQRAESTDNSKCSESTMADDSTASIDAEPNIKNKEANQSSKICATEICKACLCKGAVCSSTQNDTMENMSSEAVGSVELTDVTSLMSNSKVTTNTGAIAGTQKKLVDDSSQSNCQSDESIEKESQTKHLAYCQKSKITTASSFLRRSNDQDVCSLQASIDVNQPIKSSDDAAVLPNENTCSDSLSNQYNPANQNEAHTAVYSEYGSSARVCDCDREFVLHLVQESESRLRNHFDTKLKEVEERIEGKLNTILNALTNTKVMNSDENSKDELTLD